jgi:hypothetical protein
MPEKKFRFIHEITSKCFKSVLALPMIPMRSAISRTKQNLQHTNK